MNSIKYLLLICIIFLFNESKSQNLDSLKDVLHSTNNTEDKIDVIQNLIQIYAFQNYDSAVKYAKEYLTISKKSGDTVNHLSAYNYFGNVYLLHSEYDSAQRYFEKALSLSKKFINKKYLAQNYGNLATVYSLKGDYKKAAQYQKREIELFESLNDTLGLLISLGNLSINQFRIGDFKEELKTAKRYNDIAQIFSSNKFYLESKGLLAWAFASNGSLNKAKLIFEDIFEKKDSYPIQEDKLLLFYSRYNDLLTDLGDIKKAKKFAEKHLKNIDLLGNVNYYKNKTFSKIYLSEKEYEKAIDYAQLALTRAKVEKEPFLIKDSYNLLQKAYSNYGKYDSAYYFLNKYKIISDSLFNTNLVNTVKKIEAQFELEAKETKIKNLEEKEKTSRVLIYWQTVGILLFTFLIIFLVFGFYSNKKKSKELLENRTKIYEQELKIKESEFQQGILKKENELKAKAAQIGENKAIIDQLKEKLAESEKNIAQSKTLNDIIDELSLQNNPDLSLKEFEFKFREIYPKFFTSISENFPSLTKTELRVCAFLKMNLTSKEIAAIINTSPLTINSHRYSIRKKLNLSPEDNIFEYLQKF